MEKLILPSLLNSKEILFLTTSLLGIVRPLTEKDEKLSTICQQVDELSHRLSVNLKYSSKSLLTGQLEEFDKDRDLGLICVRDQLSGMAVSLIPERAEAAKKLYIEFERLGTSFYNQGYKVESSLMESLFQAFDEAEAQQAIEALGLLPDYEALKASEAAFVELSSQRLDELTNRKTTSESATSIVKKLVPELEKLVAFVQLYSDLEPDLFLPAWQSMETVCLDVSSRARARHTRHKNKHDNEE